MNQQQRARAAQGAVAKAEQAVRATGHIDAKGRVQERLSEYFDFKGTDGDEKAKRKVTRIELLAILDALEKGKKYNNWRSRLWRFLKARMGTKGTHAVPPTKGEIERGEATPA